jgi:hypothetical protein
MKARLLTAALLLAPIQAEAAQRLVSSPFSQSFVDKLPLNTPASTMWACSIRYLGTRPVHVLFSVRTGPNQVGACSRSLGARTTTGPPCASARSTARRLAACRPTEGEPMKTRMVFLPVRGEPVESEVEFRLDEPDYDELKLLIEPLLDGARLEHVTVLGEDGKSRRDLFVNEFGSKKGLPINDAATAHYWRNTLSRRPDADMRGMPQIHGPAVLFPDRQVWF